MTQERPAQDAWVSRVLAFNVCGGAASHRLSTALDDWRRSRGEVVTALEELESAIREMGDKLSDPAIILVRAIAANLTVAPTTKQSVRELRRYLETDSIIDDAELENGFGIEVRIREPLLSALDDLDREIAA